MIYLFKYSLTVQFSTKDYARQLHNKNLLNIKSTNHKFPQNFTPNLDQKVNQQQNTLYLEQEIYASHKDFTPALLPMLETFRRSG